METLLQQFLIHFFWFCPIPAVSVGQKESSKLLRYCGPKPDSVAGVGEIAGCSKARGLAHDPTDGMKSIGGLD